MFADNFVSTVTKLRFLVLKVVFLLLCKCVKQAEATVPYIYCVWGILATFFVDMYMLNVAYMTSHFSL